MPRSNFGYVIATHLLKLVIIIQQQEFEPEDLLIQVNEDEVNAVEVQENQIADQNIGMQGPIIPPEFEVELPHLNHPLHNVLPEEVQEDEFMDVEEMQAENNVVEAQEDPLEPQNVQIGMVRIFNSQAAVPVSHWFDRMFRLGRWAAAAYREEEGVKKRNQSVQPLKLVIATGWVRVE